MIESVGLSAFPYIILNTINPSYKVVENADSVKTITEIEHVVVYEKNGKVTPSYQTHIDYKV